MVVFTPAVQNQGTNHFLQSFAAVAKAYGAARGGGEDGSSRVR